ncbi:MAG TPA: glycosyltransferase family 2 protein, partial [Acetobacteraceae bacterium]
MRIVVITPAFNEAPFIAAAICSVLAQTHRDLRMVVVDDGSTDATSKVVTGFADPRLRLIWQCNAGVAAARNRGMAAAEGDALLFLDADDWLTPTALATLAATLDATPEAVVAVGPYARMDVLGQPTGRQPKRRLPNSGDLLARLVVQNQFANGGHLLIRRDAARQAGTFLPGVIYGEDWDYFVRLALQGPFAFVPTPVPLLFVRSRAEGAYRRFAADPDAFAPCMAAIYGNPDLAARFGAARLAALRRLAEAENAWIVGRELVRQGRAGEGRYWLARSVAAAPSVLRMVLLAAAHVLPLLPQAW